MAKVTFIYSNGKTFNASGVDLDSIQVTKNKGGDTILNYISFSPELHEVAFDNYVPCTFEAGISKHVFSRESMRTNEHVQVSINAREAGLLAAVVRGATGGAYIIPTSKDLSFPVIVDAIRLI